MLGPLQVRLAGAAAAFRTDAERALLAYLAAHQGRAQRRDTLAGLLAPDRPDAEALTYLRNRLARLRDAIGDEHAAPPWLGIDRKQIALRSGDDIAVDLAAFERRVAAAEAHAHRELAGCPTCLTRLDEAVALVRGELLAGLNFASDTWQTWLAAQREHYAQRALAAMTLLREARLARGEWAAALAIALRQLALEPWLEAAHRAAMFAHAQLGDRNAALAQFERCEKTLWGELGAEPEAETVRLRERIFDGAPLAAGRASAPDNLPQQSGVFFGRETEQAQLLERLVDPRYRLITIAGAGGIGKTRLSIEAGQQARASFPDGVWFVALHAINGGAEQIQIAVGEAAGLAQGGKQLSGEQVLATLRHRRALLIFDNCEAALGALAFLPEWLRRAPQIAVLATSREPLNFAAESVVLLGGLPTGTAGLGAAEAMFAERGRMARDDFAVAGENVPQVRAICALVDGSPLGIALAAAWVRRRSLAQIRDEISRSLDFLSTRLRDADPRHRSMRAVFEASWRQLAPEEQAALAALSVFPATFTADAAHAVAGATQATLDALCEKSLLQQQHGPGRFHLHSLLRQFAADMLAEQTPATDRAFALYFHDLARARRDDYAGLQPEWHNFAAAIGKAHALALWPALLGIVQALDEAWFRQIRFADMRAALALALDAARALRDEAALARTLLRLGEIEMELNSYAEAAARLAEGVRQFTRLEDGLGIARSKYFLSRIHMEQAQDAQAIALSSEAQRIFQAESDWLGVARTLNLIALCHMKQNPDFAAARAHLARSVAIQRGFPPSGTYVEALRYLARVESIFEDYAAAELCLLEAADVSRALRDLGEYAAVLFDRLVLHRRQNQLDAALRVGTQCLELFQKLGSLRWEALVKTQLAVVQQARQQPAQALELFSAGLEIFADLGDLYEQAYSHYYLYKLHAELGANEESQQFKQQALRLNQLLRDPQLGARLA